MRRPAVLARALPEEDATIAPTWARRLVQNLAVVDGLVSIYFLLLVFALLGGRGPGREACLERVAVDISIYAAGVVLTRGGLLREGSFSHGFVYRASIFVSVLASYFQLRHILPAVTTHSVDAQILAFDLKVFGVEPAIAWDRYVTAASVEWFAFFYFSYFWLLIVHVIPISFAARSARRNAHFILGVLMVFCTGHLMYMLVPGYGPHRLLEGQFHNPLRGGIFWRAVLATVEAGGAQKDIFPSLHTALPTYFAIFSFMHRKTSPYRYTWPVLAFFTTQIVVATMFLRWHWLIDVVVGAAIATAAALISGRIVAWEESRRHRLRLPPAFRPVPWVRNLTTEERTTR